MAWQDHRHRVLRVNMKRPDLAYDERIIRIVLDAPDALFDPEVPTAEIIIDPKRVGMAPPQQIEIELPEPEIDEDA